MVKEKVAKMLEYAEAMADRCNDKGDVRGHDYWMGKVNAYQNILAIL